MLLAAGRIDSANSNKQAVMSFLDELKRRNVFRVGVAYVIIAWLIAQVTELALDSFAAPDWVMKTVLFLLVIGFPLALLLAWAFELTPEGIKREHEVDRSQSITSKTGKKLKPNNNYVIELRGKNRAGPGPNQGLSFRTQP